MENFFKWIFELSIEKNLKNVVSKLLDIPKREAKLNPLPSIASFA